MQPTGGTNDGGNASPPRQTSYPVHRRLFAWTFGTLALLFLVLVTLRWFAVDERGPWDLVITLTYVAQIVTYAALAWVHTKTRLEADAEGLHVVNPLRRSTYPWGEIAEIRPSIAKGKRTYLVLVQSNRRIVDLPITEEHLDELRRWHQAAT